MPRIERSILRHAPAGMRKAALPVIGLGLATACISAHAQAPVPPWKPPGTIAVVSTFKPSNEILPEGKTRATPDPRSCAGPQWPAQSLKNGETGVVTLTFLIGEDGAVRDKKIVKSSGSRDLDKAAITGMSLCRFKPATEAGKPVTEWMQMQYVWTIEK